MTRLVSWVRIAGYRPVFACLIIVFVAFAVCRDIASFAQSTNNSNLNVVLQERLNQHIAESDRDEARAEAFRLYMQDQIKDNERRFTALETLAESNTWWLRAVGASIVLIAIKEIVLFGKLRKNSNQ